MLTADESGNAGPNRRADPAAALTGDARGPRGNGEDIVRKVGIDRQRQRRYSDALSTPIFAGASNAGGVKAKASRCEREAFCR
jgi:hypothetical protein